MPCYAVWKICNNRKNANAAAMAEARGKKVGKRSKAGSEEMMREERKDPLAGRGEEIVVLSRFSCSHYEIC